MRKLALFLLFIVGLSSALQAADKRPLNTTTKVKFITAASYSEVRSRAREEGKIIFIDFYATWCSPCSFMDETTFMDDALSAYMNRNIVSYKVDVEDFDGYSLKQQFGVRMLPTLIILDAQGRVLERLEQTLTPSKLQARLQYHDTEKNRGAANPTNAEDVKVVTAKNAGHTSMPTKTENKSPNLPTIKRVENRVTTAPPPTPSNKTELFKDPRTSTPTATAGTTTTATPKPRVNVSMPTVAGSGLYEFSVKKRENKGFSVQTGVFAQLAFVLKEVEMLQKQFPDEPVLVHVYTPEGKTEPSYRIFVGVFTKAAEAEPLKAKLKAIGKNDPTTKNLSTVK